jgi:hypothetical protein
MCLRSYKRKQGDEGTVKILLTVMPDLHTKNFAFVVF